MCLTLYRITQSFASYQIFVAAAGFRTFCGEP
jgi:hypothetical protein